MMEILCKGILSNAPEPPLLASAVVGGTQWCEASRYGKAWVTSPEMRQESHTRTLWV